ncbi:MAG: MauE/DoxX family redox-associated membrane protein [Bacteroidia bacterium]
MKIIKLIALILMALFMIYGGVNHFLNPAFYDAFMPDFFPKLLANYASGAVEILLGVGLFIPKFRSQAAWGILILMLIFLPLHVWDLFREQPAIGSQQAAMIRVPVQFLFIGWAYWLTRSPKEE